MVNGNEISVSAMGVSLEQIWDICVKYNLRRLNANVFVSFFNRSMNFFALISKTRIFSLSSSFCINLINQQNLFQVQENCFHLADQIITLASAVLGQKSGFPLLSALVKFTEEPSADDSTD